VAPTAGDAVGVAVVAVAVAVVVGLLLLVSDRRSTTVGFLVGAVVVGR
jgi:predicted hotdog family 3-hydroxylacyl-ACP dehydratase